jgi:signal transduction histidine kinase
MFVGNIAVESTPGSGTTVVITLPLPAQRTIDRVGRESA